MRHSTVTLPELSGPKLLKLGVDALLKFRPAQERHADEEESRYGWRSLRGALVDVRSASVSANRVALLFRGGCVPYIDTTLNAGGKRRGSAASCHSVRAVSIEKPAVP